MLGVVVPAGGPVVAETVPYAVPDVGREDKQVTQSLDSLTR